MEEFMNKRPRAGPMVIDLKAVVGLCMEQCLVCNVLMVKNTTVIQKDKDMVMISLMDAIKLIVKGTNNFITEVLVIMRSRRGPSKKDQRKRMRH